MYLRTKQRNDDDLKEVPWNTPIEAGDGRSFSSELPLGLLSIHNLWLVHMCPITLEIEVAYTFDQACRGTGNQWEITEPYISVDAVHMDPGMCQQIVGSIMRGIPLKIEYTSQATQMFIVPPSQSAFSVAVARAFAGIRGLIISFFSQSLAGDALKECNFFITLQTTSLSG